MSLWRRSSVSTAFQSDGMHGIDGVPYGRLLPSNEAGDCHHASQLRGCLLTHHCCPSWGFLSLQKIKPMQTIILMKHGSKQGESLGIETIC